MYVAFHRHFLARRAATFQLVSKIVNHHERLVASKSKTKVLHIKILKLLACILQRLDSQCLVCARTNHIQTITLFQSFGHRSMYTSSTYGDGKCGFNGWLVMVCREWCKASRVGLEEAIWCDSWGGKRVIVPTWGFSLSYHPQGHKG